jgi:hypothetical protein
MSTPRVPHAAWEVFEVNWCRSPRGLPTQSERCNSCNDSIRKCTWNDLLLWRATNDAGVCVTCEPLRTGFYRREELQRLFRFTHPCNTIKGERVYSSFDEAKAYVLARREELYKI